MKDFFQFLGTILSICFIIFMINTCNKTTDESSFAKEFAKGTRKIYDDVVDGLGLKDTTKADTLIKKDTTHIDDWMKH